MLTSLNGANISAGTVGPSQLAADAVDSSKIQNNSIVNADISSSAGITDSKLATIQTPGKVLNSATTATNANTANAIVARDSGGGFSAGDITVDSVTVASASVTNLFTLKRTPGVVSGGIITPSSSYLLLPGLASTHKTNGIANGSSAGTILILEGPTAGLASVTVTNGGNVTLAASSRTLNNDALLTLVWNGTKWCEISYSDNQ